MGWKLAELFVSITGDRRPFDRVLGGVMGSLGMVRGAAGSLGGTIGGALAGQFRTMAGVASVALNGAVLGGAAAAAVGLAKGVSGASDLNESLSKTGEVFGPEAEKVKAYVDQMADKFGMVKGPMLDAASSIGLLGNGVGLAKDKVAAMSIQMAGLAADASSFYNVSMEDALAKIRSGLSGEAEPMKALGVMMDETSVKAQAAAMGYKKVGGELSQQAKFAARAALITRGLAVASGDLARTQGSVSNQTRELWGRIQNLGTSIGQALLPALGSILQACNRVFKSLPDIFGGGTDAIEGFANGFSGAVDWAMGKGAELLAAVRSTMGSPAGEVIRGGIGAALEWVGGIFGWLRDTAVAAVDGVIWVVQHWGDLMEIAGLKASQALTNVGEMFSWLLDAAGKTLSWFASNWREVLTDVFNGMVSIATNAFTNLVDLAKAAWEYITNPSGGFNYTFTPLLQGFEAAVKELPDIAAPALTDLSDQINSIYERMGATDSKLARDKLAEAAKPAAADAAAKKADQGGAPAQEKAPKIDWKDFGEYAKNLQEKAFGKDGIAKDQLDVQKQQLDVQKQTLEATKKKGPGFGLAAPG